MLGRDLERGKETGENDNEMIFELERGQKRGERWVERQD